MMCWSARSTQTCSSEQQPTVEIRRVTADDELSLRQFTCRVIGEPWTQLVEELIQQNLAFSLGVGEVDAVGAWDDESLVGVAAWRSEGPSRRRVAVLAVATGAKRRGIGRELKLEVLDRARRDGIESVVSIVDWNNDAMLGLNYEIGARIVHVPNDPGYMLCVFDLR